MKDDERRLIKDAILDEDGFVKATFSGQRRGYELPWRRVAVRPVLIKHVRHLQVSYLDDKQDITKNYHGSQVDEKTDELLALPFSQINVLTTEREIQVQISRKGVARVHQRRVVGDIPEPSLSHDREKPRLISADAPDPFLMALEIQTPDGRIRANKRRKYLQINEFLRLVADTAALEEIAPPVHIVDCGCGSADLTFAVYHYLNHIVERPSTVVGIDVKADLMTKKNALAQELGWHKLRFQVSRIIDFEPEVIPDMVMALHACDTATDEALAQAVRWGARLIFSAPCCHHHLQAQMADQPMPQVFQPVLRHGILKERLGDVLTDSFRAQILRIVGYSTDVMEFIAPEHTDKNLMIRAVKQAPPGDPQMIAEYRSLVDFWGVTPYLATLLKKQLTAVGVEG
ncbi:MAG: SAM-dependent methyltransferase [Anaerolineae bacterium]|nr:SAM-dependent methyltransferase [Anaerolineae bacterium]